LKSSGPENAFIKISLSISAAICARFPVPRFFANLISNYYVREFKSTENSIIESSLLCALTLNICQRFFFGDFKETSCATYCCCLIKFLRLLPHTNLKFQYKRKKTLSLFFFPLRFSPIFWVFFLARGDASFLNSFFLFFGLNYRGKIIKNHHS
jgi:hypothetical protein